MIVSIGFTGLCSGAFADTVDLNASKVDIVIDGNTLDTYDYDQNINLPAFIYNDRTLLPLRKTFELFGLSVKWDGEERSVTTTTKEGKEIWLQIDNNKVKVDGVTVELDVPAKIFNDRTFVPVRFITETVGYKPVWNGEQRTVTINMNDIVMPSQYAGLFSAFYDNKTRTNYFNYNEDISKKLIVTELDGFINEEIKNLALKLNVQTEKFTAIEIEKSYYVSYKDSYLNTVYEVIAKSNDKVFYGKFTKFDFEEMKSYVKAIFK